MSLIDECIEALGENIKILYNLDRERILEDFDSSFPITEWGRIDWEKVTNHAKVNTIDELISFLNQNVNGDSNDVYVIWDEGTLPIIHSDLDKVFEVIDDVTAVSFDTWIFSPSLVYVIEIFHDGEVRIGLN
ncbi:hypothetical protein AB1L05_14025 [Cytobacillus horneckiae]|uniref:Uncharacterized protein n=1 Tax=Cytobacillus horneckiae TaxID=549687 RepID=A0A2N0Z9X4_9BACI|nr:hypothetical protein [Cytobacillus horneckiae]MBN6890109.1 hypothetical protein [Cytobacillus horneckiae]MCM3181266.1 hypothetical protein [Cytobacillus horneckiae]MEC1155446.1 hypothetical protein [Cytobacillus horneckiae]MED2939535.1 hypothetical protein [Cytobacillus horneckiae]PKG26314.1 hypothetical protein CWS20_24740 [Cytobacillus horneckiae]